ncbi:flagellar biosynthetic protein FliO [Lacimicrobium alkaliphilum]|uniref:Flagellar protein n=1 Tax=Lacimicrobium alkaliphilum TaxID=1526571 RepID=A0ABQ1RKE2_9ALTE|nr:flagellar biosynthetic protein FliO [Lacimicrobium alkaliphilum]GGD72807.1 flagellar protein [Lacimicrobium alkaliphilum]
MVKPLFCGLAGFTTPSFANNIPLSSPADYVSILLSLVLVVALVFMLGYLMRRFNVTHSGSAQLKLVGSMSVGTKERIMVVEVGKEQFLLGVTSQSINHLARLDNPIEVAQPGGEHFRQKLSQFMQGNKKKPGEADE